MDNKFSFEEIFDQNKKRIHYHIHKLQIRDPHNEFYVEGMYALWNAYKKYEPNKGPMPTYFNFTIRNHLIDVIRKEERIQRLKEKALQEASIEGDSGNRNVGKDASIPDVWDDDFGFEEEGVAEIMEELSSFLTEKQMRWVEGRVIQGMSNREIARQEGVTEEAVKSWGREVRRKVRKWG